LAWSQLKGETVGIVTDPTASPRHGIPSENLGDAIADAAEKSAANGARHSADAADRGPAETASHGTSADCFSQFLPKATGHVVQIIERKLVSGYVLRNIRHDSHPLPVEVRNHSALESSCGTFSRFAVTPRTQFESDVPALSSAINSATKSTNSQFVFSLSSVKMAEKSHRLAAWCA
jgi:hypothetical protein